MDDGAKLQRIQDARLNKYLDEIDGELSECCDAPMCQESGICCECKEPSETHTEAFESAQDDYFDQKYEQEKEARWE